MKSKHHNKIAGLFVVSCALLIGTSAALINQNHFIPVQAYQSNNDDLIIRFNKPGSNWYKDALPIGNGRMGALILGGETNETIQMNEKTLWTGGPNGLTGDSDADKYGNKNVADPNKEINAIIDRAFNKLYSSDENAWTESEMPNAFLPNNRHALGNYQSFAEMNISFPHDASKSSQYQRYLNLNTAIQGVSYKNNGEKYKREIFASYPDDVMVYKISSTKSKGVNFNLSLKIPHMDGGSTKSNFPNSIMGKTGTVKAEGNLITLRGTLKSNNMIFEGQYKVIQKGGTLTAENDSNNDHGSIQVNNADSAYIIMSLGTNYAPNFKADYVGEDPHDKISETINKAADLGYDKLLQNHLKDYQNLFNRVSLNLNNENLSNLTIDDLLSRYKSNKNTSYLEALHYQYGRYLTIAGSRKGSLPMNLQGLWNTQSTPEWQADYHTNINIQMNYWPGLSGNLCETQIPLIEYIDQMREPGRLTFEKTWGLPNPDNDPEPGFLINCSNGPLGFTGNINSRASFAPTGTAFVAQNLYDYYNFTQNSDYLDSNIYPILKEMSKTFLKILEPGRTDKDKDRLYMAPSYSPEHGPWTVGTYYDQQLVYQTLSDTLASARMLHKDEEFASKIETVLPKLHPVEIGEDGQIKEWQKEGKYNRTLAGKRVGDDTHRHTSHLVGLWPCNIITENNPEWFEAAKVTLQKRGSGFVGWTYGMRMATMDRVKDGEAAYEYLNKYLKQAVTHNLFNTTSSGVFQIDATMGIASGTAEALLQSHQGYIDLIPAIPNAWKNGSYSGLLARGNFEVDCRWQNKEVVSANITSKLGNKAKVKFAGAASVIDSKGNSVAFENKPNGIIEFETSKGESYTIKGAIDTTLSVLINNAKNIDTYRYTKDSKDQLQTSIANAENLIQNSSNADELATAYDDLNKKYNSLILRDKTFNYAIESLDYYQSIKSTLNSNNSKKALDLSNALMALMDNKDKDPTVDLNPTIKELNAVTSISYSSKFVSHKDSNIKYGYPESGPDKSAGHSGAWYVYTHSKYTNGNIAVCRTVGSWLSYEFKGARIQVVTEKAQGSSAADIYIDGVKITSFDSHANGDGMPRSIVFDSDDYNLSLDGNKTHTIKIISTGNGVGTSGFYFRLEGFNVFNDQISKENLIEKISQAKSIDESLYTTSSVKDLNDELTYAYTVLYSSPDSQSDIDEAIQSLQKTIDNLTLIGAPDPEPDPDPDPTPDPNPDPNPDPDPTPDPDQPGGGDIVAPEEDGNNNLGLTLGLALGGGFGLIAIIGIGCVIVVKKRNKNNVK